MKRLHEQNSGKAYAPPRQQQAMKLKVLPVQMPNAVPQEERRKRPKQNQTETPEGKVS